MTDDKPTIDYNIEDVVTIQVACNGCMAQGPGAKLTLRNLEADDIQMMWAHAAGEALEAGWIVADDYRFCPSCKRARLQASSIPSVHEVINGAAKVCRELLAADGEPSPQLRRVAQAVLADIERIGGTE